MKNFKICLIIFSVFSITTFQVNSYAAEEKHEGHQRGSHEESQEEDSREEHSDHGEKREGNDGHKDAADSHEGHDDDGDEGVINLDEEARSMIQLKTEKVQQRKLSGHLKVYGKIAKDTENYSYITFDGEGKVESIDVKLGAIVSKGEKLLTISKNDGASEDIVSQMHGAVLSIFAKQGDRVDSLTSLLSIIDVDTLRATIDIYERDLRLVKVEQKVLLTAAAYPDKEFIGEVVYISPQVDEHTQAIKVRVDVDNPDHLLRLGMFVSGELIYASNKKAIGVPLDAIQQLNGEDIVFVTEDGNNLRLREVVLGRSVNDYVEIIKGLNEGETVVTQGSFYLKSEQAKEAFGDGHNH
jgi:multidrug efflux pump subunit AcrA (membrane-fusion protein)